MEEIVFSKKHLLKNQKKKNNVISFLICIFTPTPPTELYTIFYLQNANVLLFYYSLSTYIINLTVSLVKISFFHITKIRKKMAKSTLCIQRLLLQRRDQMNFPV